MEPYYADEQVTLYVGDCLKVLTEMLDASVDAIVTDPPAGVSFMGRAWDSDRGGRDAWIRWLGDRMREAYRVLKPGGHALVWALPRTSHWTAMALEDAGFQIRDCVLHLFGGGFPKSLDVGKAIDKAAGAERQIVGPPTRHGGGKNGVYAQDAWTRANQATMGAVTAPATDDAARWSGWGTALKPGQEIWWLVRKPMTGTVAANVLEYGTGALNIDACRIAHDADVDLSAVQRQQHRHDGDKSWRLRPGHEQAMYSPAGRWPTNVVFTHGACVEDGPCADGCPVAELDAQSGVLRGGGDVSGNEPSARFTDTYGEINARVPFRKSRDVGGASRYFPVFRYEAKAPASERPRLADGTAWPTVKPLGLMRWLIRLITPPDGLILDCFAGSGATAEAAVIEGFRCLLIEQDPDAAELIRTRLSKPIQPTLDALA
jgi:site-specific DNA-methyltransferase (adenine-specific)